MRKNLIPMYGLEDVTHYGRNLAFFLQEKDAIVKEVNSALSYMERMSYATTKLIQQFHDQIENVYPSYKKFLHEIECPTALAFYEQFPSPSHLEGETEEELALFLRIPSHNTCSTQRAVEILDLIEQDAIRERDYQYARKGVIQSIVRNIRFNQEEIKRIEKVEEEMLKELDYQLETIPGVNTVTASALVAQIGDIKRYQSVDKLTGFAGVAPIYHGSAGKGKNYQNKSLGNRELYNVPYFLAIRQIYINNKGEARNPEMPAYFEYKISKGKTKIQTLLCIMRRLIQIIYSMMKYKTAYEMPEIKEKLTG